MKFNATMIAVFSALVFVLGCGDVEGDSGPGSCQVTFQCDGTECVGQGNSCTSGQYLEEDGITDQASCEQWGESKAAEKNAELISATYDEDGDC